MMRVDFSGRLLENLVNALSSTCMCSFLLVDCCFFETNTSYEQSVVFNHSWKLNEIYIINMSSGSSVWN